MIIALLIIDSTIPRISVYTGGIYPLNYYLAFFIGIVLMYGLMQYIVIAFVRQKIRNSKMYRKTKFSVIYIQIRIYNPICFILSTYLYNLSNDFCCEIQYVTVERRLSTLVILMGFTAIGYSNIQVFSMG